MADSSWQEGEKSNNQASTREKNNLITVNALGVTPRKDESEKVEAQLDHLKLPESK